MWNSDSTLPQTTILWLLLQQTDQTSLLGRRSSLILPEVLHTIKIEVYFTPTVLRAYYTRKPLFYKTVPTILDHQFTGVICQIFRIGLNSFVHNYVAKIMYATYCFMYNT